MSGVEIQDIVGFTAIICFVATIALMILKGQFVSRGDFKAADLISTATLNEMCNLRQSACKHEHPLLCQKIEQIRNEIKTMDAKREAARKEQMERDEKLFTIIGEVRQFMKDAQ